MLLVVWGVFWVLIVWWNLLCKFVIFLICIVVRFFASLWGFLGLFVFNFRVLLLMYENVVGGVSSL